MKAHRLSIALLAASLAFAAHAADPAADATKKSPPPGPVVATDSNKPTLPASSVGPSVDSSAQQAPTPPPATESTVPVAATTPPPPPPPDPSMLPKVEVNKSRITNLDIEISEKQRAIDREKQQTKVTRLDDTLNNSKVTKAFSIFGGSSSDDRSNLAKERVRLLEEEKEILEAMKTAQTREEKDELKQELDILRQSRRDLDSVPK